MLLLASIALMWLLASGVALVLCFAARQIDGDIARGRRPTDPAPPAPVRGRSLGSSLG